MNITAPRVDKTDSKHLLCLGLQFTGLLNSACFEKTHQLTKKFYAAKCFKHIFFIYIACYLLLIIVVTPYEIVMATLTLNILIYVKKNKFLIV